MKTNMKIVSLLLGIFLLYNLQLNGQAPSLDSILQNARKKLLTNPAIQFQFNYFGEGILKNEKPLEGSILIAPKQSSESFNFENVLIRANSIDANEKFEVSKLGYDFYYLDKLQNKLEYSNIYRLGSPFFSSKIKLSLLNYQFLPVLADYQQYNPKLGEILAIDSHDCQEIIFDIPEHDFHARFYIGLKDFIIYKIENWKKNGEQLGKIVYQVQNFEIINKVVKLSQFDVSKDKNTIISEYTAGCPGIGTTAPDWKLNTLDHESEIGLSDFRGKIVVLDFWATWCAPCIQSMKELVKLNQEIKDKDVVIVGITYEETGNPQAIAKKMNIDYLLLEGNKEINQHYGLDNVGIPLVYILDKNGKVIDFVAGYHGETTLQKIKSAIQKGL
ncbi:MAG: TlpA disulfide reductase family protein [Bacteroidales bacterium]